MTDVWRVAEQLQQSQLMRWHGSLQMPLPSPQAYWKG